MWQVSPSISAAPPDSSSPAASIGGSASKQPAPGSTATDISVHTVHKITRTVLESLAKECRDAHDNPPADGKKKRIDLEPAVTLGIAAICPATDGGYVLLGLPCDAPSSVFDDVLWSSEETLKSQCAALTREDVKYEVGATYSDVDEIEDLVALRKRISASLDEHPHMKPHM